MRGNKKRRIGYSILLGAMILTGAGMLLSWKLTAGRQEEQVRRLLTSIKDELEYVEGKEGQGIEKEEGTPPFWELRTVMETYNQRIYEEEQESLKSERSYQVSVIDPRDYGWKKDSVGIITIPKINVEMPLYLGATYEHLSKGLAQLSQTSMPIGGENTNCVIAGHRGWKGAPYLRDIHKLKVGDEVILQNMWGILRYEIKEIKDIAPQAIEEIKIQEGKDLLTLLSCHPYGSGGKQRRILRCERLLS